MSQQDSVVQSVTARRWVIDRRARLMAAMVAALTLVFLALALPLQRAAGTVIDLTVTASIQTIENPVFAGLMMAISELGFRPWSWLVFAAATAGFWLAGFRRAAIFLLATPGAGLLAGLAKLLVERPRPTAEDARVISQLLDYSYPSGHVVSYVSIYGFLFFLTYVLFKRSIWRTAGLIVLGLLIGLVGLSRIYLGHHWVSDVLGGYALGTAYLLILIEVYRITTVKPARDPRQPPPR